MLSYIVYGFKNQNDTFSWLTKNFVSGSFTLFWLKTKTASFCALIRHLYLVPLLGLRLQKPKPEVSMTWQDLCLLFFFMVLIFNKGLKLKNMWWKTGMSDQITPKSEFLLDKSDLSKTFILQPELNWIKSLYLKLAT